jgi:hypothetical protein
VAPTAPAGPAGPGVPAGPCAPGLGSLHAVRTSIAKIDMPDQMRIQLLPSFNDLPPSGAAPAHITLKALSSDSLPRLIDKCARFLSAITTCERSSHGLDAVNVSRCKICKGILYSFDAFSMSPGARFHLQQLVFHTGR